MVTKSLLQDLEALDNMEGEGGLSTEDLACNEFIQLEWVNRMQMEEISQRLKSRVRWIREGDRNTKFFTAQQIVKEESIMWGRLIQIIIW